ncbi:succinate dehydrogenase/fumarate reductase flavoprotein subunit [Bradyrhizobium sp. LB7.1]
MALDQIVDGLSEVSCDVLVIGGGTAGPMAALKAKLKNPKANVVLLEKANVKRSGAISMGMDGLNNAVIPGYATPEQYTTRKSPSPMTASSIKRRSINTRRTVTRSSRSSTVSAFAS